MHNRKRKWTALLLAIMLTLQLLPLQAAAEVVYSPGFTLQGQIQPMAAATPVSHTVYFQDMDGTLLKAYDGTDNALVLDGTRIVDIAPGTPSHPGFAFARWTPVDSYVTAPESSVFTYTAQYTTAATYHLNIRYLYRVNGSQAAPPYTGVYAHGDSFEAVSPTIKGYQLEEGSPPIVSGVAGTALSGDTALDYTIWYEVNTGTPYAVEHWFQSIVGSEYVQDSSLREERLATSGAVVTVNSLDVTGFVPRVRSQSVTVAPDGSTVVKLYYDRLAYVITYDTSGGTYIPPFTARHGATITPVADPTRSGYSFAGWDQMLPATLTRSWHLTARWDPAPADYTVMYWLENANDTGYTFKESMVMRGITGTQAVYQQKTYPGFHLNTDKTNTTPAVLIRGDGSTIKHVYYSRDTYEVIFYQNNKNEVLKTYPGVKQGTHITAIWDEMHLL